MTLRGDGVTHVKLMFRNICKIMKIVTYRWGGGGGSVLEMPPKSTTIGISRPDIKQSCCRSGEECEFVELCLRRGLPLVLEVVFCVSSSLKLCSV